MLSSVVSLLPILRAHAQFKPSEVAQALNNADRSWSLISPDREKQGGRASRTWHRMGFLGFAGFLNAQFRMHDFQLGRVNCQRFLRDQLYVHVDNPLVKPWVQRMEGDPATISAYRPSVCMPDRCRRPSNEHVQVIPLVDKVRMRLQPRPWPRLDGRRDIATLAPLMSARARVIVPATVRGLLTRLGITDRRLIGRIIRNLASDVITDRACEVMTNAVERDLRARGLLM
ncbi:MAG: hypothetical protein HC826_00685 [Rhodospirillales bacterium]|nr:hypothetical protein [Rhodospirillales bacterium]